MVRPRRSEVRLVEVGGERLRVWIEQGQVRAELPFDVDFQRLARMLREDGYFYAHDPERIDAQGWGARYDAEGYYPYWVFRSREPAAGPGRPARAVFAFPPQEYVRPGLDLRPRSARRMQKARAPAPDLETAAELTPPARPVIGPRALDELRRWVPYLRRAAPGREG